MLQTETLILCLKAATITQLGFLILNFLIRVKFSYQNVLGSLFSLSLIAYFICPWVHHSNVDLFWAMIVYTGCHSVSVLFFLFVSSLFEDDFKLRPWHGALFLFVNTYSSYILLFSGAASDTSVISKILFSSPQVFYLILILWTLAKVLNDKKIDLLESRREFRVIFASLTGLYSMGVVLVEVITRHEEYSATLDLVNSFFIFILVFFISFRIFEFRENSFPIRDKETKDEEEPLDENLLKKLNVLLADQKVYLHENLTILGLAQRLNVPEKKVRRLINKGLGYRNFNEFLNYFRIQEAKAILSDPGKKEIQVLRIAMDLGYGSLAPFNRAFREIVGTTPSDFRKQKELRK
ncbi:AraC family transcriptional regulator [Leptospira langatensis]|uniref:AraC family transcriptional regulator n=1 Tax=Leptospira langatensis TaxID=2484983 RepID=A0A5F1ZU88_9LEPT|nr:helix-turn-helix domain-containing protein [Leptospira langatensis]TGJ98938.1 AraC family transcriptional regulator [Leptospira langatensis]TGL40493.1 AraC family transcriptional regulator [Leptospira langatensis]